VISELCGEALVRLVGLGDDEQAGRVLVDTVYDARSGNAADPRQLTLAVMQQRIDQRSVEIAGGGVNHKARRLVDDNQVIVLVDHDERNILGLRLGGNGCGHRDSPRLAASELERGLAGRLAAQRYASVRHQRLDALP
jgi:hypothetical protein